MEQFWTHLQIESKTRVRDALVQASSSAIINCQNKSKNKDKNLKVSNKSLDKKRENVIVIIMERKIIKFKIAGLRK